MKKFSFLALAGAALMLASCSNDEDLQTTVPDGTPVEVTFTTQLPADLATRANDYGQGTKAKKLQYAVYKKATGEFLFDKTGSFPADKLQTTVTIPLVTGEEYSIVFWAQNESAPYTFDATNKKMTANYKNAADQFNVPNNNENLDAFYLKKDIKVNASELAQEATLTRPFAQINIATGDKEFVNKNGEYPKESKVNLSNVPNVLNLLSGTVEGDSELTLTQAAIPVGTISVGGQSYDYLSMSYVLAPIDGSVITSVLMNVDSYPDNFLYTNIPVKRNYKTNIVGDLLTTKTLWTVTIYPIFEDGIDVPQPPVWDGVTRTAVTPVSETIDGVTYQVYNISNGDELAWAVNNVTAETTTDALIRLVSNIDLGSHQWTAGNLYGTFDGQNFMISNLSIDNSATAADAGLYAYIMGGTVKNLVIYNADIKSGYISSSASSDGKTKHGYTGAVAGEMAGGYVDNVKVIASEISGGDTAGGIVGLVRAECSITNCANYANVTVSQSSGRAGGIVGATYKTEVDKEMIIKNCLNYGNISGYYFVGGIAGLGYALFDDCKNYGNVSGTNDGIGGISGNIWNYGHVRNCYNYGTITSQSGYGVGGIVGWIRYSTESAYAQSNVVEVSGNCNYGSINNVAGYRTGGIVGSAYDYAIINNNKNYAPSITGPNGPAAGILGDGYINGNVIPSFTNVIEVCGNTTTTPLANISGNPKNLIANGTVTKNEN